MANLFESLRLNKLAKIKALSRTTPPKKLRLRVFAGPNGSGKSTVFNLSESKRMSKEDIQVNTVRVEYHPYSAFKLFTGLARAVLIE